MEERRKRLQPHIDGLIAESRVLGFSTEELKAMVDKALDGEER